MPFTQQKPTLPVNPPLFSGQELQANDRNLTNDHVAFYGKKIFLPSNSSNIHRITSLMDDQNVVREDVKARTPVPQHKTLLNLLRIQVHADVFHFGVLETGNGILEGGASSTNHHPYMSDESQFDQCRVFEQPFESDPININS